jgi:hypothetical protein
MEVWLVKSPVYLLGDPGVTVTIDGALQQSVPPSATRGMRHAVSDQGSARIEACMVFKGHRFIGTKTAHRHLKLLGNSSIRLGRKEVYRKQVGGFDLPRIKLSAGRPNPLWPAFGLHFPAFPYAGETEKNN